MNDTTTGARRVQIQLLREAGPQQRLAMATTLTAQSWQMAHKALAKSRPKLSDTQRQCLFVKIHYGSELATRLQIYLQQRSST